MENFKHHLKKNTSSISTKKPKTWQFFWKKFIENCVWGTVPWSPQLRRKTTMHAHNLIFNNLNVFGTVWWSTRLGASSWWVEPTHEWNICAFVKFFHHFRRVEIKKYLKPLVLSIFKTHENKYFYFMFFVSNKITTPWNEWGWKCYEVSP